MSMVETDIPLDTQVRWHLTSNHYPPHSEGMVGVALKAIELALCEEWDHTLQLPEEVLFRGSTTITVGEAVESLHLEPWLEEYLDEEY